MSCSNKPIKLPLDTGCKTPCITLPRPKPLTAEQYFLQVHCLTYNMLSDEERQQAMARRIYAKMKSLNEKILAS